jgi:hypothetical protein
MYKHANPANMGYQAIPENQALHYIAMRAINKDEALTLNYHSGGGGPTSDEDNWFALQGIDLLSNGSD